MEKIHLIGWALLLVLVAASATTAYVNSIAEAQEKLGENNSLEEIGCKVYNITKEASTQQELLSNDWQIEFAMEYKINGIKADAKPMFVSAKNNTEAAIKAIVEPLCNQAWLDAQTKYGQVDKVIVKTQASDNPILSQIYSAVRKSWAGDIK